MEIQDLVRRPILAEDGRQRRSGCRPLNHARCHERRRTAQARCCQSHRHGVRRQRRRPTGVRHRMAAHRVRPDQQLRIWWRSAARTGTVTPTRSQRMTATQVRAELEAAPFHQAMLQSIVVPAADAGSALVSPHGR